MSDSRKKTIENAVEVIERFGGIRPMSSKINVPVTTIQGWKKRNAIPANRVQDLLDAANENDIDLSGLVEGFEAKPSKDQESKKDIKSDRDDSTEEQEQEDEVTGSTDGETDEDGDVEIETVVPEVLPVPVFVHEQSEARAQKKSDAAFAELAVETQNKAVAKSVGIVLVVLLVGIAIVAALLWPKAEKQDERLAALESALSDVKKQQTTFKGLVPEDWSGQLESLKQQVENAKQNVGAAVGHVQSASHELLGENAGTLEDRLVKLEAYVQEVTESNAVAGVLARVQVMRESMMGRETLANAMRDLSAIMQSDAPRDDAEMNGVLDRARQKSGALSKAFQDVPTQDLKAAAMLLAMAQMRESLNREDTPFGDDLQLLMKMVGDDNPELEASLQRLAPFAEEGVLTPTGLSNEFRGLAGDVVVSSLKGEDVAVSEKAKARMNELFQVEKDGELITGTPTQATLNRAQNHLDNGDIVGAVSVVNTLDSEELEILKPWLEKAKGAIAAGNVETLIRDTVDMTVGSGYLGGSQFLDKSGGLEKVKR